MRNVGCGCRGKFWVRYRGSLLREINLVAFPEDRDALWQLRFWHDSTTKLFLFVVIGKPKDVKDLRKLEPTDPKPPLPNPSPPPQHDRGTDSLPGAQHPASRSLKQ